MYLLNLRVKEVYEFYIWVYLIKGKFYEIFLFLIDLMFIINRVYIYIYVIVERMNIFFLWNVLLLFFDII